MLFIGKPKGRSKTISSGDDFEIITTKKIPGPAVKILQTGRFENTHEHAAVQIARPAGQPGKDRAQRAKFIGWVQIRTVVKFDTSPQSRHPQKIACASLMPITPLESAAGASKVESHTVGVSKIGPH